jgi:hypothetical protein
MTLMLDACLCTKRLERTGADAACSVSNAAKGKMPDVTPELSRYVLPSIECITNGVRFMGP